MKKRVLILVFACLFSWSAFASQYVTVKNFSQFYQLAESAAEKYGASNVLLVYDIDCTLLTPTQDLGSDIWFSWQAKLLASDPSSPYLISKNFNELLQYQMVMNYFYPQVATESDIANSFQTLQNEGFTNLILTSRGSAWLMLTQQQLTNADINYSASTLGSGSATAYEPYQLDNLSGSGLTSSDASVAKLKAPRPVVYANGVFYGSGQNKGIMLKTLLNRYFKHYDAILFLDDSKSNTDNVWGVYQDDAAVDMTCVRYSYDDPLKLAFEQEDKRGVNQQWLNFKKMMESSFNVDSIPVIQ